MTARQYQRLDLGRDSSGRTRVINRRTAAMLADVERRLGKPLVIIQGSYMKGHSTPASGPTHDGGGVIDVRSRDLSARGMSPTQVVRAMRRAGFVAWHRDAPAFPDEHIHAIALGDREMDPSAARQVDSWRRGRNGLSGRSEGPDDGPKVRVRPWELVRRIVAVRLAQRDLDAWRKAHSG